MADATYQPKVYRKQGGDELIVASGGEIDIESGGTLAIAGSDRTAALATAPAAVAAGYKLARGVGTLDGTNPTAIDTGLSTLVSVTANIIGTAVVEAHTLLVNFAGTDGTANLYAFDGTDVAATGTETVSWIAVGT